MRNPGPGELGAPENDDAECLAESAVVVKKARGMAEGAKLAIDPQDLAKRVRLAEWSRKDLEGAILVLPLSLARQLKGESVAGATFKQSLTWWWR